MHNLSDSELEVALNVDFKKPLYVTLAALISLDRFMLGNNDTGMWKIIARSIPISLVSLYSKLRNYFFGDKKLFSDLSELTSILVLYLDFKVINFSSRIIFNWLGDIFTASTRAKEYNYQLLINAVGKK